MNVTVYLDDETAKLLGELSCVPYRSGNGIIKPSGYSRIVCLAIKHYYSHVYNK